MFLPNDCVTPHHGLFTGFTDIISGICVCVVLLGFSGLHCRFNLELGGGVAKDIAFIMQRRSNNPPHQNVDASAVPFDCTLQTMILVVFTQCTIFCNDQLFDN